MFILINSQCILQKKDRGNRKIEGLFWQSNKYNCSAVWIWKGNLFRGQKHAHCSYCCFLNHVQSLCELGRDLLTDVMFVLYIFWIMCSLLNSYFCTVLEITVSLQLQSRRLSGINLERHTNFIWIPQIYFLSFIPGLEYNACGN